MSNERRQNDRSESLCHDEAKQRIQRRNHDGNHRELAKLDALSGRETARRGQRIFRKLELFPKPVIAAVNGFALVWSRPGPAAGYEVLERYA